VQRFKDLSAQSFQRSLQGVSFNPTPQGPYRLQTFGSRFSQIDIGCPKVDPGADFIWSNLRSGRWILFSEFKMEHAWKGCKIDLFAIDAVHQQAHHTAHVLDSSKFY